MIELDRCARKLGAELLARGLQVHSRRNADPHDGKAQSLKRVALENRVIEPTGDIVEILRWIDDDKLVCLELLVGIEAAAGSTRYLRARLAITFASGCNAGR